MAAVNPRTWWTMKIKKFQKNFVVFVFLCFHEKIKGSNECLFVYWWILDSLTDFIQLRQFHFRIVAFIETVLKTKFFGSFFQNHISEFIRIKLTDFKLYHKRSSKLQKNKQKWAPHHLQISIGTQLQTTSSSITKTKLTFQIRLCSLLEQQRELEKIPLHQSRKWKFRNLLFNKHRFNLQILLD